MPDPRLVHVETVEHLTPDLIRIVFGGDGLAGFAAGEFTDHYVKLQVPPQGADYAAPFDVEEIRATRPREQWPRTRTYTVAALGPGDGAADDRLRGARRRGRGRAVGGRRAARGHAPAGGPGRRLRARPGRRLAPAGRRPERRAGDRRVARGASPPAAPSTCCSRSTAPRTSCRCSRRGDLQVSWLHGGDDGTLADALRALEFPAGAVHAFVHGEASAVRAVRRHLLAERGDPARVRLDLRLLEADPDRGGLARGQAGVEPPRRGGPRRSRLTPGSGALSR